MFDRHLFIYENMAASMNEEEAKLFCTFGLKFLNNYRWLLDKYVVDFYVEDHWERLPEQWRIILEDLSPTELGMWMSDLKMRYRKVWPLSLLAMRQCSRTLSLSRKPVAGMGEVLASLKPGCHQPDLPTWGSPSEELSLAAKQHKKLQHVFRRHVKPKKQHEIVRIAQVAASSANVSDVDHILDVGSGLGHLSRLLSYGHGLNVSCVDLQEDFSKSARLFDSRLEESMRKVSDEKLNPPKHLTMELSLDMDFNAFAQNLHRKSPSPKLGLVGLHTCGDLGPTLLHVIVNSPHVMMLNSVGCCYMKVEKGYPLSRHVADDPNNHLSYQAKEIACHAIEAYAQRLMNEDHDKLKVHAYRAVLESLLASRWPELRRSGLRSVKNAHLLPFDEYATKAIKRHDTFTLNHDELMSPEVQHHLHNWWRVVVFYSLRLMLAPAVETVLLLDRLLYLKQNGIDCRLLPIFDPTISPRNHVLIAIKKS